jgi:hypothetical protein
VICTKESHFQFDGLFKDQIGGVEMGSPLGPLFANIFMTDFEEKYLSEFKKLAKRLFCVNFCKRMNQLRPIFHNILYK